MKVGVMLPQAGRSVGRQMLTDVAQQAEGLGFDSAWIGDHLVVSLRELKQPYPYSSDGSFPVPADLPFLEPLTALAFLARCTERITLGTGVLILPYRHPLYIAKVATTIDLLSEGRFILGVGVGWMSEEFEALGVPFVERGKITDEQLRCIASLWEGAPDFQGQYYHYSDVGFAPKPTQQPRIPIWVGGDSAGARRRAARYGDAWYPVMWKTSPERLAAEFQEVQAEAARAGRDPEEVRLTLFVPLELSSAAAEGDSAALEEVIGELGETLKAYGQVGVEHAVLHFTGVRQRIRLKAWEEFARQVLPALHEPVER